MPVAPLCQLVFMSRLASLFACLRDPAYMLGSLPSTLPTCFRPLVCTNLLVGLPVCLPVSCQTRHFPLPFVIDCKFPLCIAASLSHCTASPKCCHRVRFGICSCPSRLFTSTFSSIDLPACLPACLVTCLVLLWHGSMNGFPRSSSEISNLLLPIAPFYPHVFINGPTCLLGDLLDPVACLPACPRFCLPACS